MINRENIISTWNDEKTVRNKSLSVTCKVYRGEYYYNDINKNRDEK